MVEQSGYPMELFSTILRRIKRPIVLDDSESYQSVGVRWYGRGCFLKETKMGMDIRRKKQWLIRDGDIVYNKLFAWKGAFAVAKGVEGRIASDKFPTYEHNSELVDLDYLKFYFENDALAKQASALSRGAASISKFTLNPPEFLKLTIPLPSISEQRSQVSRIRNLLLRNDNNIEHVTSLSQSVGLLRRSFLLRAFLGEYTAPSLGAESIESLVGKTGLEPQNRLHESTTIRDKEGKDDTTGFALPDLPSRWNWVPISQITIFVGSGSTPRGGRSIYVEDGVPFIRSQNVHAEGLLMKGIALIPPEIHETMARTHVKPGDVLLNITGASIGRSTCVPNTLKSANVNQHVCIIRTGKWMIPKFMSWFLNSPLGRKQILMGQSGATREGLNYTQLRAIKVPLAPIGEQEGVVEKIEPVLNLLRNLNKHLDEAKSDYESFKASVLHHVYQGLQN